MATAATSGTGSRPNKLDGYPITQYFDTVNPKYGPHKAIDIAVPSGTPVYAVADGVIKRSDTTDPLGGLRIDVQHAGGISTDFAHLSKSVVQVGQVVKAGQLIGYSGKSGSAVTGAHLHFSASKDSKPIDPLGLFDPLKGTAGPLTSSPSSPSVNGQVARKPVNADGNCDPGWHRVNDGIFGVGSDMKDWQCEEDTGLAAAGDAIAKAVGFLFDGSNWLRMGALAAGSFLTVKGAMMVLAATGTIPESANPGLGDVAGITKVL